MKYTRWRAAALMMAALMILMGLYAIWADSRRLATKPALSHVIQAYCLLTGCDARPAERLESMLISDSTFTEVVDSF